MLGLHVLHNAEWKQALGYGTHHVDIMDSCGLSLRNILLFPSDFRVKSYSLGKNSSKIDGVISYALSQCDLKLYLCCA